MQDQPKTDTRLVENRSKKLFPRQDFVFIISFFVIYYLCLFVIRYSYVFTPVILF